MPKAEGVVAKAKAAAIVIGALGGLVAATVTAVWQRGVNTDADLTTQSIYQTVIPKLVELERRVAALEKDTPDRAVVLEAIEGLRSEIVGESPVVAEGAGGGGGGGMGPSMLVGSPLEPPAARMEPRRAEIPTYKAMRAQIQDKQVVVDPLEAAW